MIFTLPDETPVTTPVVGSTVALPVLLLLHTPPVVASLSAMVDPLHAVVGPVIAGSVFTVIAMPTEHPPAV